MSDPAVLQKGKELTLALQTLGISRGLGAVTVWWVLDVTEGGDVGRMTAFTGSDVMGGEKQVNFCPYMSSFRVSESSSVFSAYICWPNKSYYWPLQTLLWELKGSLKKQTKATMRNCL